MADAKDIEERIKRRVKLSAPILETMGVSEKVYERVVLNALVLQPQLVDCEPRSIDGAIMRCINAGLLPDGKEAAIVPFNRQATFMPMVDGLKKLVHRATRGLVMRTVIVYKDDKWEYEEGLYPVLKHIPSQTGSRLAEDIIAVYAVAKMPMASEGVYVVMLRGDIDRHMAYSRSSGKGPWQTHYGEMAKKTVDKQICRLLPKPSGFAYQDVPQEFATLELQGYDDADAPLVDLPPDPADAPSPLQSQADPQTGELPPEEDPPAEAAAAPAGGPQPPNGPIAGQSPF